MKAISQRESGDIDVLELVDIPTPKPSRKEVLVQICSVGFNPVDVKMRAGLYPNTYPMILGVDFSGVVAQKGDLVKGYEVGDRVFGMSLGKASNGSYAEYTCVPEQMIAKIPDNLSHEEAAAIPIAYMTAFEALIGRGALQENRPLFIAGGSGGVGSAAISLAKAHHAGSIFTLAGSEASAQYLMSHLGISDDHIVRYQGLSVDETARQLIEKNDGNRFYMALDFVGRKAKELCFEVVDYNGHLATALPEDEHFPISLWGRGNNLIWNKSLSIHMVYLLAAARSEDPKDWMFYKSILSHLAMLFEREELVKPYVEKVGEFSLETVRSAHTQLEEGHTKGKLVMSLSRSKEQ